jgi:restriction system protein
VSNEIVGRGTELDRQLFLKDGRTPVYANRAHWAVTYLHRAGALKRTQRGVYQITDRGLRLLQQRKDGITVKDLMQFPEFREFVQPIKVYGADGNESASSSEGRTPLERLEAAYQESREALASELLERVRQVTPSFFEQLVLDLLTAMGYGGTLEDAARAVGRAGDEGIDGVIKEDKLGLDVVYVQAKRWQQNIGRPDVQAFVGALAGKKARKGVFITTSDFTKEAREYVQNIDAKIVLIDGRQLAELMIDHDVGVTVVQTYKLKRVDSDYFESE